MTASLNGKDHLFADYLISIQFRWNNLIKINRQRPTSVIRKPELKIPTLTKWLISPSVCEIIKVCKKHLVLKTNSNINIYMGCPKKTTKN